MSTQDLEATLSAFADNTFVVAKTTLATDTLSAFGAFKGCNAADRRLAWVNYEIEELFLMDRIGVNSFNPLDCRPHSH